MRKETYEKPELNKHDCIVACTSSLVLLFIAQGLSAEATPPDAREPVVLTE